jgi:predicted lipid-binding transport protein (Tim44 family)
MSPKYDQHKVLSESEALMRSSATRNLVTDDAAAPAKDDERKGLYINGNGMGGLAVGFLFFFIAMCGFNATMSLFVNTKLLTNPLLLGKVEY